MAHTCGSSCRAGPHSTFEGVEFYYPEPPMPPTHKHSTNEESVQQFDQVRDRGDSTTFCAVNCVSAWGRASGHVDGISCTNLLAGGGDVTNTYGVNGSPPVYFEREHRSGIDSVAARVADRRQAPPSGTLELAEGEQLTEVSGMTGTRRLLQLRLETSAGQVLEVGMAVADAAKVGGRPWRCSAPVGNWRLAGFRGTVRPREGVVTVVPVYCRRVCGNSDVGVPTPATVCGKLLLGEGGAYRDIAAAAAAGVSLVRAFHAVVDGAVILGGGEVAMSAAAMLAYLRSVHGWQHPDLVLVRDVADSFGHAAPSDATSAGAGGAATSTESKLECVHCYSV
jgi:hypothetical protein